MNKTYQVKLIERSNDYREVYSQDLYTVTKTEDPKLSFYYSVCDLYECPEDAILGRDLVSADEILGYIELGMQLAKAGYTEISVETEQKDD